MENLIDRIKISCGYKTEAEIARALGLSPQNFLGRKKTGGIKERLILHAVSKGINEMWLRTGHGQMSDAPLPERGPATDDLTLKYIAALERILDLEKQLQEARGKRLEVEETHIKAVGDG